MSLTADQILNPLPLVGAAVVDIRSRVVSFQVVDAVSECKGIFAAEHVVVARIALILVVSERGGIGECSGGGILRWHERQKVSRSRVDSIRWNNVPGEWIARKRIAYLRRKRAEISSAESF